MKKAFVAGVLLILFIVASPVQILAAEAATRMAIGAGQSRTVTM